MIISKKKFIYFYICLNIVLSKSKYLNYYLFKKQLFYYDHI